MNFLDPLKKISYVHTNGDNLNKLTHQYTSGHFTGTIYIHDKKLFF